MSLGGVRVESAIACSSNTYYQSSFPETQHVILRTLVLLGSTSQGSSALLEADGWFTVPKLAAEHETALEVIEHVYAVAAAEAGDISISLPKLHETMSVLTDVFLKTANPTSLFESLNKLVEFVPDVRITKLSKEERV